MKNKKYLIEVTDGSPYIVEMLDELIVKIDTDLSQETYLNETKINSIYKEIVSKEISMIMLVDFKWAFLVYDLLNKIINHNSKKEEFKTCYNYLEILKLIYKEFNAEIDYYLENETEQ